MAQIAKFLNPIRQSLSSISHSKHRLAVYPKFKPIKTFIKRLELEIHGYLRLNFQPKLNIHTQNIRNVYSSGSKLSIGSLLGVSFMIGSISFMPHVVYAMDVDNILVDDRDYSDAEEDSPDIGMFVRKFWLPVFFFFTVLGNCDHPVLLLIKVVLFLLTTKPSPLSVYVFVEQLCHQSMRQEPFKYILKSLYANKVDVQDYKLFCLATVEVREQKLILVGILGGWWVIPLSWEAIPTFWNSALY